MSINNVPPPRSPMGYTQPVKQKGVEKTEVTKRDPKPPPKKHVPEQEPPKPDSEKV